MSLRNGIRNLLIKTLDRSNAVGAQFEKNVLIAANETERYLKEITPPPKGAERGVGTVTGNLSRHWKARVFITYTQKKGKIVGKKYKIALVNSMQYASYVNDGHRVDKHFVPWLRVNPGTGLLEKYTPDPGEPLFGIVVGTKTTYVPPTNMVKKARKHFQIVLKRLNERTARGRRG